jgi:cysteinyl-tRNA synthetase
MNKNRIAYFLIFASLACSPKDDSDINPSYRQYMRDFVQNISKYAKGKKAGFIIIPQNGQELVTLDGEASGLPDTNYIKAIDGVGREDLLYGYNDDDRITPANERDFMILYLTICKNNGIEVLVTDYCWTQSKMDNSYQQNFKRNYISFAAPDRQMRVIPDYPSQPFNENSITISELSQAKNFLYLINTENYTIKQSFISAIAQTNYDVLIIDYFWGVEEFTAEEINQLKSKKNGGKRLVIAYLSIGEAEDYRYYWKPVWKTNPPSWLKAEDPNWEGNYVVAYWEKDWQNIIFGNSNAYLDKIIKDGFDGAYLDIIDAFEYFE